MNPVYRGAGAFTSGTGALTVGWPTSGYAVGDLGLMLVESANQAITTPTGWTQVSASPQSTGSAGVAGGVMLAVFYKLAASTAESSVSVADSGDHTAAQILVFGEVDQTTPIQASAGSVLTPGSTSITCPAVTTTSAGALVINCVATDRDATSTVTFSAWANANLDSYLSGPLLAPTSFGEIADAATSSGVGGGVGAACGIKTAAGSTGTTTVTQATAVTAAMVTVALAPITTQSTAERITQAPVLALERGDPPLRMTQAPVLVLAYEPASSPLRMTQAPVLVLTYELYPLRITQAPVLVLEYETPELTQECQCWSIVRKDGIGYYLTTHDEPVDFRGQTYIPDAGLTATAASAGPVGGSGGGDVSVSGILSDESGIDPDDIAAGLLDGARVEVWIAQWGDTDPGFVPRRIAAGELGQISYGEAGYKAELQTSAARVLQRPLLQAYSPTCRAEFCDSRCGLDPAGYTVSGAVEAVSATDPLRRASRRVFTDTSIGTPEVYALGAVTWLTGDNAGLVSRVKDASAEGVFTLWMPLPHEIQVGDTFEILEGCDKLKPTCQGRGNYVNFRGEWDVPGRDAIIRTPDAKG